MSAPPVSIASLEVDTLDIGHVIVTIDGHAAWALACTLAVLLGATAALQLILVVLHVRQKWAAPAPSEKRALLLGVDDV